MLVSYDQASTYSTCLSLGFAISIAILFVIQGFIHKLHLLSIGLLLGSLHFLLQQLLEMDPILIVRNSDWDIALLLALIAVVLQRNPLEQIAALSMGYLLGDMYQAGIHPVGATIMSVIRHFKTNGGFLSLLREQ